jgi:glycosyltransferase involved in cell wall biosynthesis
MSTRTPTVSISLVTYNHEKFIAAAIRSILGQTFSDLELVIVDDGSTDDTPRVIATFDDPRIVSIRQSNGGPSVATNRALAACRGQYVALMTGDDIAAPHRIQAQLEEYQRGQPRMLFSDCDFIDDDGQSLNGNHYAANAFDTTLRTRAQMLRRFFDNNFINSVTGFTETHLFHEIGRYDPALYQLQDFQMWIDWVKKYPIEFIREPLLHYRIRGNNDNLSAPTRAACTLHENEFFLIMRTFFEGASDDLFREAFRAELRRPDLATPLAAKCEQAFLFLHSPRPELRLIGMERFRTIFQNADAAAFLEREFHFPLTKFREFLKAFDLMDRYGFMNSALYFDTGPGFDPVNVQRIFALHTPRFFQRFDLPVDREVKGLRWDPVEGLLCRVCLDKAAWTDVDDRIHEVELNEMWANGIRSRAGEFEFDTIDPSIFLPVSGRVKMLTLEGSWQIHDEGTTRARQHELNLRQQELNLRQHQELAQWTQRYDRQHQELAQWMQRYDRQHQELAQWMQRYERTLGRRLRRAVKPIISPFRQLICGRQ